MTSNNAVKSKRFEEQLDPADVALLKMAVDQILAAPAWRFDMISWANDSPLCVTAFCIGGHMAILDQPRFVMHPDSCNLIENWMQARGFLSDGDKCKQWSPLFYLHRWPTEFICEGVDTTPELAAERVEYWLETGQ